MNNNNYNNNNNNNNNNDNYNKDQIIKRKDIYDHNKNKAENALDSEVYIVRE
eukprot:gene11607-7996_t